MNRTFFLDQHGCAKNQVDGELIITRLEKAGLTRVEDASSADLIIINSCGFIESAKKESLDSLMGARSAYPNAKIILAGCLAERYAELFKEELPEADGIFGNGNIDLIDNFVEELFDGQRPVVKVQQKGVCSGDRNTFLNFKGSTYVKITEGCNNRCTFCAIPIIRGDLRSRNADEIVKEMQHLVNSGMHEINLIGQDLAAYGTGEEDDGFTLPMLIKKISQEVKGKVWIRLLYIHPDHFKKEILDEMKKDKRFLPY
ncbi:radical SAM protein, partial [Treponema sp.]|uniref:radical SAM protein n=1 Tax=Treponema sp. TaxID=166 RepID=UPI0025ED3CAD